jgi:hypothetical protein
MAEYDEYAVALGRIDMRLVSMTDKLGEIGEKCDKINGTVRGHQNWIAAQTTICESHRNRTESLEVTAKEVRDYQLQLSAGIKASRVLVGVLWALTMALAAIVGLFFGPHVRAGG